MRWFGLMVLTAAGLAAGCKGTKEQSYVPSGTNARQALEAALTKWKEGVAKPAPFPVGKVTVQVADQGWEAGQKLQAYEVVGEEPAEGTGPRVFTVKLKTAKGEQTLKYYVFGIDPLQVYSEPDYRKLTGG